MARIELVDATPELLARVAANVRPADRAELWAQARHTPEQSLAIGLERGVFTFVPLFDGEPACAFGVVPVSALGGMGAPWMVGTPLLDRHARQFLRGCRPVVAEMSRMFPVLRNAVDARNTRAIRWLRWLGFEIHEAQPMGPDRLPFHPFEKRTHV